MRTRVFSSDYCNDLYTTNLGIKWSCHSVTSQLSRCPTVLNLDNTAVLADYMAAYEVKLCRLKIISGCVNAGLVLKPVQTTI